jgi:bifunctional enzyme CysN/CysC
MATGASTADLAVVLVDARKGVLPQTRRHTIIASLLGIRRIVLAVNKIDLIASGAVSVGDEVVVAKSGKPSKVKRIVAQGGDLPSAIEGQAITLVLADEIEVSRGNMLVSPTARPQVADQLAANIVWFDEHALMPGRAYILRTETDQVNATVTDLRYRININNFAHEAAKSLEMNEVGVCNLSLQSPIAFDKFSETERPAPSS